MSRIRARLFAFVLSALPALAHADYLSELIDTARSAQLAARREWLDLGHYRPDLFGSGYTSLADVPFFFNAPNGKTDPTAELEATLAAFFNSAPESITHQPLQCRFIARYQWLKQQLQFDPARLPEQRCERFDAWYAAIAPRQLTMVFPAAHLNSPSSMFGHTLLRIDNTQQSDDTRLFSYALNFAAATDEANGMVFAVKGLLGGYPGYFSTMPYYEKVKEYNDLESRDVWEYELNFTPAEVRRLLEHAWELGQVNFDYYFFDENCSYQLLALIDVARPGHNLTDHFHGWAIPVDTLRVTIAEEGFLRATYFRPSNLTRVRHDGNALSTEEQRIALALADNGVSDTTALEQLAPGRRGPVLDVAYNHLQYRYVAEGLPREKVAGPSIELLRLRSKAPPADPVPPIPVPVTRPDQSHETARIAFGGGERAGQDYLEMRLRPAYHELVDPPAGYTAGAQINFLDITARWQRAEDRVELQAFKLVDIFSLAPRDAFFAPRSWRVSAGVERLPLLDMDSPDLMPVLAGGAGHAYAIGTQQTVFAMIDGLLATHDDLPHDYTVGIGPRLGYLLQHDHVTLLADARARYLSGVEEWLGEYGFESGYTVGTNIALRLSVQRTELAGRAATDTTLTLHRYF